MDKENDWSQNINITFHVGSTVREIFTTAFESHAIGKVFKLVIAK